MKMNESTMTAPKIKAILPPRFPWSGLIAYGSAKDQIQEVSPLVMVTSDWVGDRSLLVAFSELITQEAEPIVPWYVKAHMAINATDFLVSIVHIAQLTEPINSP